MNVAGSLRRRSRSRSVAGELAAHVRAWGDVGSAGRFLRYREDPGGFCSDVLGLALWSKQAEIARALIEHARVTVRSGHGVGKSKLAAAIALWFCFTRPASRVLLTATKMDQIKRIVWHEIRTMWGDATIPLGPMPPLSPSTGIEREDGAQILGVTAREAENIGGLRAPEMLVIADEASGIAEEIFVALEGAMSGGASFFLIGNPTRSSGYFYESHKSERFARFAIPSWLSPNVTGERQIPGLATREWIEDRREAWGGETGVLFRIRVAGDFVEQLEGKLFPPSMILESEEGWKAAADAKTPIAGPLRIGVDVAGDGVDGDESAFVARRGMRVCHLHTRSGLSPEAHVAEVVGILGEHGRDLPEAPTVVVDRDGVWGHRVYVALLAYLQAHEGAFGLIGFRGSEPAKRRPQEIHLHRDEMWFGLVDAFRRGLQIPPNVKLEGDLAAIRFDRLVNGRATVLRKPIIRRELGRSPDLGDALALCSYEPADYAAQIEAQLRAREAGPAQDVHEQRAETAFDPYRGGDPYEGMRAWRGR